VQKKYIWIWGIPAALWLAWFAYWEFRHIGPPGGDLFSHFVWWLESLHWGVHVFLGILFTWLWVHFITKGVVDKKIIQWVGGIFRGKS